MTESILIPAYPENVLHKDSSVLVLSVCFSQFTSLQSRVLKPKNQNTFNTEYIFFFLQLHPSPWTEHDDGSFFQTATGIFVVWWEVEAWHLS